MVAKISVEQKKQKGLVGQIYKVCENVRCLRPIVIHCIIHYSWFWILAFAVDLIMSQLIQPKIVMQNSNYMPTLYCGKVISMTTHIVWIISNVKLFYTLSMSKS